MTKKLYAFPRSLASAGDEMKDLECDIAGTGISRYFDFPMTSFANAT